MGTPAQGPGPRRVPDFGKSGTAGGPVPVRVPGPGQTGGDPWGRPEDRGVRSESAAATRPVRSLPEPASESLTGNLKLVDGSVLLSTVAAAKCQWRHGHGGIWPGRELAPENFVFINSPKLLSGQPHLMTDGTTSGSYENTTTSTQPH